MRTAIVLSDTHEYLGQVKVRLGTHALYINDRFYKDTMPHSPVAVFLPVTYEALDFHFERVEKLIK